MNFFKPQTRFGTAEDFGLKGFKNVMLSVDGCVTPDARHRGAIASSKWSIGTIAHTHGCQRDPFFGYICLPRWAIKTCNGPTSIFWHEYGHFLNPEKDLFCEDHSFSFEGVDASRQARLFIDRYNKRVHGDKFKEIMTKLGRPDLAKISFDFNEEPLKSEFPLYSDTWYNLEGDWRSG